MQIQLTETERLQYVFLSTKAKLLKADLDNITSTADKAAWFAAIRDRYDIQTSDKLKVKLQSGVVHDGKPATKFIVVSPLGTTNKYGTRAVADAVLTNLRTTGLIGTYAGSVAEVPA